MKLFAEISYLIKKIRSEDYCDFLWQWFSLVQTKLNSHTKPWGIKYHPFSAQYSITTNHILFSFAHKYAVQNQCRRVPTLSCKTHIDKYTTASFKNIYGTWSCHSDESD
jgi:isocitrate dehydrogenase